MPEQRGMYELRVEAPEKASQTLLNRVSSCPFSGGLYLKHHDEPAQSHAMARGEAIHYAIETCTNMALESGEPRIPPEVGKDVMQAVLDERTDLAMSPLEQDACRAALWNWAADTVIDPEAIVAVETMFETEVAGWTVRGRIDRAEIANGEGYVRDVKSSLFYPDAEEFEHSFQHQFYGLLLLEGHPEDDELRLGAGLSGVHLIGEYPRIKREGSDHYFTHHAYKNRAEIHDFRRNLESVLAKLDEGLERGEWKASPGSWCNTCPARSECPIPQAELPRVIATEDEAREIAEHILVTDNVLKMEKGALKAFVQETGELVVGDQVFAITAQESEKLVNREVLYAAMRNAGLEPAEYFRRAQSTTFRAKKLKP